MMILPTYETSIRCFLVIVIPLGYVWVEKYEFALQLQTGLSWGRWTEAGF